MKCFALAVGIALFSVLPARAQVNQPARAQIPPELQINHITRQNDYFWSGQGQLDSTDYIHEYNNREYHYDLWPFSADAGDQISISVASSDFDTMAILLSVSEDGIEHEAMNDDISREITDSQIDVNITRDGNFILGVLAFDPTEQGAYTVGIREILSPAPGSESSSSESPNSESQLDELNRLVEQGEELNRVILDIHQYPLF